MQEPTRTNEQNHSSSELSPSATTEESHQDQPIQTDKNSHQTDNQPTGFWKRHWQDWKRIAVHDKLNTVFTLVIALATVIYVIVTKHTLDEIRSNNAQSGKQTDRLITQAQTQTNNTGILAEASGKQASAAQSMATQAQEQTAVWAGLVSQTKRQADIQSVQVQLSRASIRVGFVGLYALGHDAAPVLNIKFRNPGKIEARQVFISTYVKFQTPQQRRPIPKISESRALEAYAILPEGEKPESNPQPIMAANGEKPSPAIWQDYVQGKRNLYIWGRVWYRDSVGKNDPFDFCLFLAAADVAEIPRPGPAPTRECPGSDN